MFISIVPLPVWTIPVNNIDNWLSYCEIQMFDRWTYMTVLQAKDLLNNVHDLLICAHTII